MEISSIDQSRIQSGAGAANSIYGVSQQKGLKPYQRLLMLYQASKQLTGAYNPYLFYSDKQLEKALSAAGTDKNPGARQLIEQAQEIKAGPYGAAFSSNVTKVGDAAANAILTGANWGNLSTPGKVISGYGTARSLSKLYNPALSYSGKQIDAALAQATKDGDTQAAQVLGQMKEDQSSVAGKIFSPQASVGVQGFATGLAAYQTISNWDELSPAEKALGGVQTANNIGQTYQAGQAAFGGAAASTSATQATSGVAASAGSTGTAMATLGTVAAGAGAAYSGYQIAKNWGEMDTKTGAINGASFGASVGTMALPGLGTLIGLGVGAVAGAAIGQIRAGKHVDQKKRDRYRSFLADNGVLSAGGGKDENFYLGLADGTQVDISGEHWEGGRTVYDPSKLTNPFEGKDREGNKLRPYERDYTNDLEFMTGLSGDTLSMLTLGNDDEAMKQHFGTYFGLAANSNAGSRDFNKETFSKSMENMRAFYAKAGLDTADKANSQIDALFKAGKIDQTQRDQATQSVSMVFNDNFDLATQLNSTRWNGINPQVQSAVAQAKPNMSGSEIGQTLSSGLPKPMNITAWAQAERAATAHQTPLVNYQNSSMQPDLKRPLDQNVSNYTNPGNTGVLANTNLTNSNPDRVQK